MRLHTSLPLAKANDIITKALHLGRAANLLPLTVVVLDAGGKMVAMQCDWDRSVRCGLWQGLRCLGHGDFQSPDPGPVKRTTHLSSSPRHSIRRAVDPSARRGFGRRCRRCDAGRRRDQRRYI